MKGMYVNPNFVANGNETEKYMQMIKREKMEAAYQKKVQEARKPKKKRFVVAVVAGAAVAGACAAAYKAIDELKNNGNKYSEIPVPRTEVTPVNNDVIIDVTDQAVEVAAEPVVTTV